MANECLVTKLKESVNNPNLPLFGYFRIKVVKKAFNSGVNIGGRDTGAKVRWYDKDMNLLGTGNARPNASVTISVPEGGGFVDIENYTGKIDTLNCTACTTPELLLKDIVKNFPSISGIIANYYNGSLGNGVVSDAVDENNALALHDLGIIEQLSITGTLESLLEKMFSLGRTSGILHFNHKTDDYHKSGVTFNGNISPNANIEFNSTGCVVTDKATSQVVGTLNNGIWTYA